VGSLDARDQLPDRESQLMNLDFGPEDILAFEDVISPSGEMLGVRVTLSDGSERLCQTTDEIFEVLAMVKKPKSQP
jgi:hypothetical protein